MVQIFRKLEKVQKNYLFRIEAAMKKIFIVDYENTAIHGLMGIDKLGKESIVRIHCSKDALCKLLESLLNGYCQLGIDVKVIFSGLSGKNSLDFKLACDLGYFAADSQVGEIYIISKDRGLESAVSEVKHLNPKLKAAIKENILECIPQKIVKSEIKLIKQEVTKQETVKKQEGIKVIDRAVILKELNNKNDIPEKYRTHLGSLLQKNLTMNDFKSQVTRMFGKKQESLVEIALLYFNKYRVI